MPANFLSKILPPLTGEQCYFALGIGEGKNLNQRSYNSLGGVIAHCSRMSSIGLNAYMALFNFAHTQGGRTQNNAVSAKSIWADLDVGEGEKKYSTQIEALQGLVRFVNKTKLKPSIIVSSGRGIHVYWSFDTPVFKKDWIQLSHLFKHLSEQEGLKIDPACSCDTARVLRLPGTINTKNGSVVTILKDTGKVWSALDFAAILLSKTRNSSEKIDQINNKKRTHTKVSNAQHQAMVDAGMIPETPAISAVNIVANCQQVATMGKGSYHQWFYGMSVLKCCKDGKEWVHKLSSSDSRYDSKDTEIRFSQALIGSPTRCETFLSINPELCHRCKFRGIISTPVQLHNLQSISVGNDEQILKDIPNVPVTQKNKIGPLNLTIAPDYPRLAIQHPSWCVDQRGIVHRYAVKNDDDSWIQKEEVICHSQLYYKYSIEDWDNDRPESAHVFEIVYPGGRSRNVRFSISEDGNTQSIVKWFYNANMYATTGVLSGKMLMSFMNAYLQGIVHQNGRTLTTVNKFGWTDHTDPVTGQKSKGFVTGSGIITHTGIQKVHFGKMISPFANQYTPAGTFENWKYIPGMYKTLRQPLGQLGMCLSFAAPFMKYALGEASSAVLSIWSAISGQGKTQMLRAAASVWGNPYEQFIDREASTVARTHKLTLLNNIPAFMDEMTTTSEDTMHGLAYTLVGGKEKDKLKSSGDAFVPTGTWSTVTFVTANRSFKEAIAKRAGDSNATLLRIMEYECKFKDYKDQPEIREYINKCIELGKKNYGWAGPNFIYQALQSPERIAVLSEEVQHWINKHDFKSNERFIFNALALAIIIGRWAVELGFLDYDMDALEAWILQKFVRQNREKTIDLSIDLTDIFSDYITSRQMHTLTTQGLRRLIGEVDSGSFDLEDRFILRMPNREIYMRVNKRERELVFLKSDFSKWCREHNVSSSSTLKKLESRGIQIEEKIRSLTGGISWLPEMRGRCIVLNSSALEKLGMEDMIPKDEENKQAEDSHYEGASNHSDIPRSSPDDLQELDRPEERGNSECVVYDIDGTPL